MKQYTKSKTINKTSINNIDIIDFSFFIHLFIYFRINLEKELKKFLEIYDDEIGARSSRLHECKNILHQESNTLDEWKEKYKIQEVLYNKIQMDKEAEEEQRREEKILLFMMNRVARIIQRHYRRVLAQRKSKKKGKGKKGKGRK